MKYLLRAFSAEMLKTRRTLAFWLTLIAPGVVSMLQFFILMRYLGELGDETINAWQSHAQNIFAIWGILALPLFITLETALLGNMEHNEKNWKHLFALPLPRWSIYAAKWLAGAALILISQLALVAWILLVGLSAAVLRPNLGFTAAPPVGSILSTAMLMYLVALILMSIHTWVALRFKSFTVAAGVGMAAAIANIIIMNSDNWSKVFPWSLPLHVLPRVDSHFMPQALIIGLSGALVLGLLGGWEVLRRDVL